MTIHPNSHRRQRGTQRWVYACGPQLRSINQTIREAEQGLDFLARIKSSKMPPKRRRGASTAASKARQAPKTTAKKNSRTARQLDIAEKRKEDEATNARDRAESVAQSVGNASTDQVYSSSLFIIPESLLGSLLIDVVAGMAASIKTISTF